LISIRNLANQILEERSMRLHRSRIGWRVAPIYSNYLKYCKKVNPLTTQPSLNITKAIEEFELRGFTHFCTPNTNAIAQKIKHKMDHREANGESIWHDRTEFGNSSYAGDAWNDFPELEELFREELGDFLTTFYQTHYKIFYGTLYRSERIDDRIGSQMWHSDSGPGTCINILYYLQETTPEDGPLEVLEWNKSLELFILEKKLWFKGKLDSYGDTKRDQISNWYTERINAEGQGLVHQPCGPAGLVVPFLNNTIHRGGYPATGRNRTALVFHCYPSHKPTNLSRYKVTGISKVAPYCKDPSADF